MSKKKSKSKAKSKAKPKYALLVWAMLPESIDYYLLPLEEIGKEGRRSLRRAHGFFIGAAVESKEFSSEEINRALLFINNALVADPNANWIDDKYYEGEAKQLGMSVEEVKSLISSWAQYKLDVGKVRTLPKSRLIQSGCVM